MEKSGECRPAHGDGWRRQLVGIIWKRNDVVPASHDELDVLQSLTLDTTCQDANQNPDAVAHGSNISRDLGAVERKLVQGLEAGEAELAVGQEQHLEHPLVDLARREGQGCLVVQTPGQLPQHLQPWMGGGREGGRGGERG